MLSRTTKVRFVMNKKQMISNGMLATMAMMILSVIFVVLVCREAIVTQTVVSVVCFVLAAMAMSHVKVHTDR